MKNLLLALFALLVGLAGGLAYSWGIAPVQYVDASPDLLRADFKDQYRIAIAAAYAANRDLARARARLLLLSPDPLRDVKAQAQRLVGTQRAADAELLTLLAADLEKGVASLPPTRSPAPALAPAFETETPLPTPTFTLMPTFTPVPPPSFPFEPPIESLTPVDQLEVTLTPHPTATATPNLNGAFLLVGRDETCDPSLQPGLLQFALADSRRRPIPGVEIVVISVEGEDHLFTGFKSELGAGYADFVMKENVSYSARVGEGGAFVSNLSAPLCSDPNGVKFLGGISLSFQQP